VTAAPPGPGAGAPATLRVAVHRRADSFSDRWVEACRERGIDVVVVDGYASDVLRQLEGCDAFLWHFDHEDATDLLLARSVLESARRMGLAVFPDHATSWHFDDKIAQKYLLESVGAPLVPTWTFFDPDRAREWLRTAELPVVAKLRAGAGSAGVRLLRTRGEAEAYVRRMFGAGIQPVAGYFTDSATKVRSIASRDELIAKLRRLPGRVLRRMLLRRRAARQRGYVLFQQFIPGNTSDTRIAVVGDRAWGFVRNVRKNDFRASGSRSLVYDPARIDPECVRIAFETARRIGSQSMAFDFVRAPDGRPLLVEISYGYNPHYIAAVPGQWAPDLSYEPGERRAEDAILDLVLASVAARR